MGLDGLNGWVGCSCVYTDESQTEYDANVQPHAMPRKHTARGGGMCCASDLLNRSFSRPSLRSYSTLSESASLQPPVSIPSHYDAPKSKRA